MDYSELIEIGKFCKENWSDRCRRVIKIADDVCENRFIFDMPWDFERTEKTVAFGDKVDWYATAGDDEEFLFQLNRHGFLLHLGQAFILTGNDKYSLHFCRLLKDWLDNVPYDETSPSPWRSLELGFRAVNWFKAFRFLEHMPHFTDELRDKIKASLKIHIDVLLKKHSHGFAASNWGIIQDSGLFAAAVYLEDFHSAEMALKRLTEEVNLQIMADGVHCEQSCGYHNAVLLHLMDVMAIGKNAKIHIPQDLKNKAQSMAMVNIKWLRPDGRHPLFGDSDDNDIRDVISRSAELFGDAYLKGQGYPVLDYDSAWILGVGGIEHYAKISGNIMNCKNFQLTHSGTTILRSGWDKKASWLCFHNGYTGGGHAHGDKLHFDLMLGGRDFLVDSGRCTYRDTPGRRFVKSPLGHNTTVLRDEIFLNPTDSWSVETPAPSINEPMEESQACALIGGSHLGYLPSRGIVCSRQILWIKPNIYVVFDSFLGGEKKQLRQFYHFSPNGTVKLSGQRAIFTDGIITGSVDFLTDSAELKITPSLYSPCYNATVENQAVEADFEAQGDCCAVSVIFGGEGDEGEAITAALAPVTCGKTGRELSQSEAQGIIIKTPREEYTVTATHKELFTPLLCSGHVATGRLTVFRNEEIIFTKW